VNDAASLLLAKNNTVPIGRYILTIQNFLGSFPGRKRAASSSMLLSNPSGAGCGPVYLLVSSGMLCGLKVALIGAVCSETMALAKAASLTAFLHSANHLQASQPLGMNLHTCLKSLRANLNLFRAQYAEA
jgi:hypothetical protein